MRRATMLGFASVAALAISAIAVGSASAAKLTLTDHGEALKPGYEFQIYGNLPEDFSFPETSDGGGLYECEGPRTEDQIDLEVVSNSQPTDELKIMSVEYEGIIQCVGTTTIREARAFPYIYEGGSIKLRASGRATMPLTLGIEYEAREEEPRCFYPSRKPASNNATTNPQPLDISFSHELRLARADSAKTCPKRAGLQMGLAHTYDYEGEEELIDEQITSSR
jgi:hypothetical protein